MAVNLTRRLALLAALLLVPLAAPAETRLMMVDEPGCPYCAQWEAEVGDAYARTDEGRRAPLMRVDIRDLTHDGALAGPVLYTPTFVLLVDGREAGRIEGYPGEDFFWGLLGQLLDGAGA